MATIERSVLLRQWFWPLRLAFWSAAIGVTVWIFGMLSQAAWATHRHPEDPVGYQAMHLEQELSTLAGLTPVVVEPAAVARFIGDAIHHTALATATLVSRALMNIPGRAREFAASDFIRNSPDPGGAYARELVRGAGADWNLLILGTYGFAVRTGMYLAMLPALALGCLLGAVDGLVARASRKANAGRESSSIYHRAKLGVTFVLITGYLACLALPDVTHPNMVLLPLAVAAALLLRLQAAYYKKYL
ncbi:DUF4400 domain-containing protein [Ideonella sp. 4Y16]|uniref:DUF4400 domain-containing protein n=1 Tax=Ideonella alba TaxID=2824118 RepID=UPI001B385332|nr:DUF4400 domain-containing protein [Ideonella alba]MBQ0946389.1 DUF4400 domain-containing protein [Ideonella alba]